MFWKFQQTLKSICNTNFNSLYYLDLFILLGFALYLIYLVHVYTRSIHFTTYYNLMKWMKKCFNFFFLLIQLTVCRTYNTMVSEKEKLKNVHTSKHQRQHSSKRLHLIAQATNLPQLLNLTISSTVPVYHHLFTIQAKPQRLPSATASAQIHL